MASITAFTGNVPQNYETFLGPLFFEPYALDLAQRIAANSFHQLLELAAGTGRVTRHLLPKLAPGGRLLATDLNEAMLAVGRQLVPDSRITWQAVDAHNLPYEEGSMDGIVCQFGVMFFADKIAAFKEALRVLKPGATFYFNTWDHMQHNALTAETRGVMDELFPDDPPTFLEKGPYSFWEVDKINQTLKEAGFTNIRIKTAQLMGSSHSADDCVQGIIEGTPINAYLQERNVSAQVVKDKLKPLLERYRSGGAYLLPMQAHVCTATKPLF